MNSKKFIPFLMDNLIWFLLAIVMIFFGNLAKNFFSAVNFLNILLNASVLGLLVIGQSFTLITGNFDLSASSVLGLAGLIGIWLMNGSGWPVYGSGLMLPIYVAIPIILLMGILIGLFNGVMITKFRMNNFVETLAMLIALRGVMLVVNGGQTAYNKIPAFNEIGLHKVGPVPLPVIVLIVMFAIAYVITTHTPFGRELYAVGANRKAALASGVKPERRIIQVYMISGFMAAFAGWVLAARLTNAMSSLGDGMIFEVMAASVIGGISLKGGQGKVINGLGGVLLLTVISAGLNMMAVNVFWVETIRGFVIIIAMLIEAQKVRYIAPTMRKEEVKAV
ncbi:MAG: ABC transporter permease [Pelolinea sp.]|nr:ABC transporter permease [Pelolinea sp.]